MSSSSNDPTTGAPVFDDEDAPDSAVNPTEVAAFAASVGTRPIGDTSDRAAYAYARDGLAWLDTDTRKEYVHNGSGWVAVWAEETAPGSVVPVAGANYTLSLNALYKRGGFLHGSIAFARTAVALTNAETVITTPVGARPAHAYNHGV